MSAPLDNEVSSLDRKIKILLSNYHHAREEIDRLRKENQEIKQQLKDKQQQVDTFQNRIKISSIAEVVGSKESTGMREKIDEYIKEIDKCIAHLSK